MVYPNLLLTATVAPLHCHGGATSALDTSMGGDVTDQGGDVTSPGRRRYETRADTLQISAETLLGMGGDVIGQVRRPYLGMGGDVLDKGDTLFRQGGYARF